MKAITNQVNVEINKSNKEIENWLQYVKSLDQPQDQLRALESSINKYPFSKKLIQKYIEILSPRLHHTNNLAYKNMLERFNSIARVFLDNCSVEDYDYAKNLYETTVNLGRQFMEENYEKRKNIVSEQLTMIENLVEQIKQSQPYEKESLMNKLENQEQSLDKNFIQKVGFLKRRYHNLTKEIIQLFEEESEQEVDIKAYNLRVVNELKRLEEKLELYPEKLKDHHVIEVTRQLGRLNTALFTAEVNLYYQTIYNEFFIKLSRSQRAMFTEQVLQEKEAAIDG